MTITVNPYLMILVFIVFIATLYCLNIWLYKPIFSFMDNRNASIAQDMQSIQNNMQETIEIDREIKQILENARLESLQIIEQATNEAKTAYEAKIMKKKTESLAKLEEFLSNLQIEKIDLKNQLLEKMPDFEKSLKLKISQI
ncbi:F0F1 ATP synthase subunit B' [Helicobacter sp. 12S02232-10]|uniref:FoF1 ATP synthase subunit B' n=1 Tax=Helicobacter sp. 12S02232-10 TaxID=1476197 RepID=UPI000BA6B95A|nr:FoF1 ATP synthase subunit B' [Helicobacter sp. 12S02232-10]PAF49903.1 F0F1 ATP synthase subunit B' [Helicobacter sp. 12S02232-10]